MTFALMLFLVMPPVVGVASGIVARRKRRVDPQHESPTVDIDFAFRLQRSVSPEADRETRALADDLEWVLGRGTGKE